MFSTRRLRSHGRAKKCILELPVEIVDMILYWLTEPGDLSRLSRACRTLYSMIVPDHLHWRRIHVSLADQLTFLHLSKNRRHAGHVRGMWISDPLAVAYSHRVLGHYRHNLHAPAVYGTNMQIISNAANHLGRLVCLDLTVAKLSTLRGFFHNLRRVSPSLTRLSVDASSSWSDEDVAEAVPVINELGGYTHFKWCGPRPLSTALPFALVLMVTTRCPNLESLIIHFARYSLATPESYPMICRGRWPRLKVLSLHDVDLSDAIVDFLCKHPLLEKLSLLPFNAVQVGGAVPRDILPVAREVCVDGVNDGILLALLKPLPGGKRRPINFLSLGARHGYRAGWSDPLIVRHLQKLKTLRVFEWDDYCLLSSEALAEAARACPTVTKVLVTAPITFVTGADCLDRIASSLSAFAKLREVEFISATDPIDRHIPEVIHAACNGLQRLNSWKRECDGQWMEVKALRRRQFPI